MNWHKFNPHYWLAIAIVPVLPNDKRQLELLSMVVVGIGLGVGITVAILTLIFQAWPLTIVFSFGNLFFLYTAYLIYHDNFTSDTEEGTNE